MSNSDIKGGFVIYVVVMLILVGIYFALQTTAWGRHVWQIISTQPSNWHI